MSVDEEPSWPPGRTTRVVLGTAGDDDGPTKRGRGRPRTRPVDEERRLILGAALSVLAEQGYGGATIERVARDAGVQRRSVYEQFGDKEKLFVAAVDDALDRAIARMTESFAESEAMDIPTFTRHNLRTGLEILVSDPPFRAVVAGALYGRDDPPSLRARAGRDMLESAIAESLLARDPELSEQHPALAEKYAATMVGLVGLMAWRVNEQAADDEDEWSMGRMVDFLTDIAFGGLMHIEGVIVAEYPPFSSRSRRPAR